MLVQAGRPFFLDEEGGIDLGGRIIQRHNQIPLTVGHPLMGRAVLMPHHARQGFAWPLLAMGAAARGPRPGSIDPKRFHWSSRSYRRTILSPRKYQDVNRILEKLIAS